MRVLFPGKVDGTLIKIHQVKPDLAIRMLLQVFIHIRGRSRSQDQDPLQFTFLFFHLCTTLNKIVFSVTDCMGAGLVLLALAAALLVLSGRMQEHDRLYQRHVAELTRISAALPALAPDAAAGDEKAMSRLADARASLATVLDEADAGRASFDLLSSQSARRLGEDPAWRTLLDGIDAVLSGRATATELKTWAGEARDELGRVLAATGNAVAAPGGAAALRELPAFEAMAKGAGDNLQALAEGSARAVKAAGQIAELPTLGQLAALLPAAAAEDTEDALSDLARAGLEAGADAVAVRGTDSADVRRTVDAVASLAAFYGAPALGVDGERCWAAGDSCPVGLLGRAGDWPPLARGLVLTSGDITQWWNPAEVRALLRERGETA